MKQLIDKNILLKDIFNPNANRTWIDKSLIKNVKRTKHYLQYDPNNTGHAGQAHRAYYLDGKMGTLHTKSGTDSKILIGNDVGRITRNEAELLQTLSLNYTSLLPEIKAINIIGNGWTVDIIVEFFKQIQMKEIAVLSLFDGISCGQVALERSGIKVKQYFASEIDKHAIKVTQHNYPNTIQIGDVTKVSYKDGILYTEKGEFNVGQIDLVCGGSPCQGFSFAGKQLNFDDPRSKLFFEFVRIRNEVQSQNPDLLFLLENVKMKKEYQDVISEQMGVEPILIDSALVSAQHRKRLYWTNIKDIEQPEDKNITWGDVRERNIEWSPIYYSDKAMEWIGRHGTRNGKKLKIHNDDEKMQMIEASHYKKYSSQRFFGIIDEPFEQPGSIIGRRLNKNGHREDYNKNVPITQCLEVRGGNKIACLTTVKKDTVISILPKGRYPEVFDQLEEGKHYRYITVKECVRLMGLKDEYCSTISASQSYKSLGNGWQVDTIVHIFSYMK